MWVCSVISSSPWRGVHGCNRSRNLLPSFTDGGEATAVSTCGTVDSGILMTEDRKLAAEGISQLTRYRAKLPSALAINGSGQRAVLFGRLFTQPSASLRSSGKGPSAVISATPERTEEVAPCSKGV